MAIVENTKDYNSFLIEIKQQIQSSQTKAITKVIQDKSYKSDFNKLLLDV